MPKRRRGAGAGSSWVMDRERRPQQQQEQEQERRPHQKRLYLVVDDDPIGYSIRRIRLSPPTSRQTRYAPASDKVPVRRLPSPFFHIEGRHGLPSTFATIGTKIVVMQGMTPFSPFSDDDMIIQIYDTRHRCITLGPGLYRDTPIYIPVGDNLLALNSNGLSKLSFQPRQRPQPDTLKDRNNIVPWSWHKLPPPPFLVMDVNSYAVHPDGQTIVVSTDVCPDDIPDDVWPGDVCRTGIFTFDTMECEWKAHYDCTLPFTGRAYFVHSLDAFVGLSKDPATLGHLASCSCSREEGTCLATTWKLGKEKLFSDDPAETHVSARLVYTGRDSDSDFCLVQCVAVKPGNGNADDKNLEEPCYRYRLTTFTLSYDDIGDLTIDSSWVQCYNVPRETTERFIKRGDPVVFWL